MLMVVGVMAVHGGPFSTQSSWQVETGGRGEEKEQHVTTVRTTDVVTCILVSSRFRLGEVTKIHCVAMHFLPALLCQPILFLC